MKLLPLLAACLAMPCAAALAQSQTAQTYQFPAAPGSLSPPSTLTITQEGSATPASSGIVRDTPESLADYQRCRTVSDRAATSNAAREAGVMQCLKALQMRRQQGAGQ